MPSGKAHAQATIIGLLPAAMAATYCIAGIEEALAISVGVLSGLLLSPDLDVCPEWGSRSQYYARKLGVGKVWAWYWWPYGRWMRHRGVSHWHVIGTLTRVVYGLPWFLPLALTPWWFTAWVLVGLLLSDSLHIFLDRVF